MKQLTAIQIIDHLRPYLRHNFLCAKYDTKGGGCTCGLDATLRELETEIVEKRR